MIFSIHEDIFGLHFSISMRHRNYIWRKVDTVVNAVRIVWQLIESIRDYADALLLHIRPQYPIHEPSQIINLLLEIGILDDSDQILQRFDILQVLLQLIKLILKLLAKYLFQIPKYSFFCLAEIAIWSGWAINLILFVILPANLQIIFIADGEFSFDLLDSDQNLIQILLDESRRFFNSIDLLQTLRLQILIRNDSLLHQIYRLLDLLEVLE